MEKCKPLDTPIATNWRKESTSSEEAVDATIYKQLVGSSMYLVNTRPNTCYVVNQLRQATVKPTKFYWKAANHLLRYLRGTIECGLWYKKIEGVKLQGLTDVDWAGIP